MGFAPVAAVAILFIAGLASLAGYNANSDAADDAVSRAERAAAGRDVERMHTEMTITGSSYNAGLDRLTLDVQNSGSTVIDADDIDVVVDGVVRSQDIAYVRLAGIDTRYWAPLQEVEIRIDGITSNPSRAAVYAHNGAVVYGAV